MKNKKIMIFFTLTQLVMFILFLICIISFFNTEDDSQKSRLLFNALNLCLFIFVTMLTRVINKKLNYYIPYFMIVIFEIFCFSHFILGEVNDFYIKIKWWDSALHTLNGFMLGILGFYIVSVINENMNIKLNTFFTFVFSVCFATTIGVVWEIYEFLSDLFINTNMQRYINDQTGLPFIGQVALYDTMKDLMLDILGAISSSLLGCFKFKNKLFKSNLK